MCYKEAKFKSDWGLKCSTALHKRIWLLVNVGNDLFLSSVLRGYCSAQVTDSLFCTVFVFFPRPGRHTLHKTGRMFLLVSLQWDCITNHFPRNLELFIVFDLLWSTFRLCSFLFVCLFLIQSTKITHLSMIFC